MTIALILASLIAINFLLLIFSCNKTTKKELDVKPAKQNPTLITTQLELRQLSPTGS